MTKEHLNKVRAAIIALDKAANRLPIEDKKDRLLHTELQDAADGLVEIRVEISMYLDAMEDLKQVLK